jgi:predicted amidohydrolase YtcJ
MSAGAILLRNARVGGALVDIEIASGIITGLSPALASGGIDLEGRWVAPGLWDNHVHFTQWALTRQRLDLSGGASAAETAALAGAAVSQGEGVLVGIGFRDGLWADAPNLAHLDAATAERPVVLISADLHAVWLNSAALGVFGHSGHPTGLLREQEAFAIVDGVDAVPDATLDEWVAQAGAEAAARGVVGIVDLEMDWNFESWSRRMHGGFDALRVEFGIYPKHLDLAIELELRTGQLITELLAVGPLKLLTDGSLNTRTAWCFDEYPDSNGSRGQLELPSEKLVALLRRAAAGGIEPTMHAIGDAAATLALDAFEAVGCRGSIEHAQLVAASDFARFAALGVAASVQPEHAVDDRDVADRYWVGRTDRAFAWRSLLEAGAELRFGSDAPVAPLDPWVTIAAAVFRTKHGREPWHPEQALTVEDSLAASVRSSVAVGQPADLVVTDIDPLGATEAELRSMPVHATLLAGRFTHGG